MSFQRQHGSVIFTLSLMVTSLLLVSIASATNVGVTLLETPAEIHVSPSSVALEIGENQSLTAVAAFNSESPDLDVTSNSLTVWFSDNENVVTVSDEGLVEAVSPGSATVGATYGGKSATSAVTVIRPPSPSPNPPPPPSGRSSMTLYSSNNNESRSSPERPDEVIPPPSQSPELSERPSVDTPPARPEIRPVEDTVPPRVEEMIVPSSEVVPESPLEVPGQEGLPESPFLRPPLISENPFVEEQPESDFSSPRRYEGDIVFNDDRLIGFFPSDLDVATLPDTAIIQSDFGPLILPPELSVSRGEILHEFLKQLEVEKTYQDMLDACLKDLENCLSIFLNTTNFKEVKLSGDSAEKALSWWPVLIQSVKAAEGDPFASMQLYPDVSPDWPYARDVHVATVLGIVQGYYTEPESPFKPQQALTRIEAVKILLGAVKMVKWMYYDELEALLGGPMGIKSQKTVFADVTQDKTFMWWYPRYLEQACVIAMIDCTPGKNFRPQDYITEAELTTMLENLKRSLDANDYLALQNADNDGDGLKNYLEQTVYLTDFEKPDSDADGLLDGEEVMTYRTSPFSIDSDVDGLDDYEETYRYKTNPLANDSDFDGFYDGVELLSQTNPMDKESFPQDENNNFMSDTWERKYRLDENVVDADDDGMANALEYQYTTNPLQIDSDGDGYTDAQEVLELTTDPLNSQDPQDLDQLGVRITNLDEYQVTADTTPFIQGVAPAGVTVRLLLRNDFGAEKVLGDTISADNSIFTFQVQKALRPGKYQVVARALLPLQQTVLDSKPIHITIRPDASVVAPKPNKLANQPVTEEVLLQQIRVEIEDRKPVLIGKTESGSTVTATWKSLVASSALIADNVSGEFRIASPRSLELGNHEIYITATRKEDGIRSETLKIPFVIGPSLAEPALKPSAEEAKGAENALASARWTLLAFLGAGILAFSFGCLQHGHRKGPKN